MTKRDDAKHRARRTLEFKLEAGEGGAGGVGDGQGGGRSQRDFEQLGSGVREG